MQQKNWGHFSRCKSVRRTLATMLFQWQLYVLILPPIIYLLLFNYAPMYGVQIAFRNFRPKKGITGSDWVELQYLIKFITFPIFWKYLRTTLLLSLCSLMTFPISVILTLLINGLDNSEI